MVSNGLIKEISRLLAVFFILVAISATTKSARFGDPNQVISSDEEVIGDVTNSGGSSGSLTPLQLEILAQRLADYNQVPQIPPLGWERLMRAPEMKRQSRYRQCYFNPISCFRK